MSSLQGQTDDSGDANPTAPETSISDTTTDESVDSQLLGEHTSDHWRIVGGGALLSAGAGIVFRVPSLLLVTVVVVGLLAVRQVSRPPEPALAVERSLSPEDPETGETVEVETTITNVGDETLPDCRFVDLVPDELQVTGGTPRLATSLRPGGECTLSYEMAVSSGSHRFDGVYAIVSDRTATQEREYELDATRVFTCRYSPDPLQSPLLRTLTTPYAGRLATENSGEGLEFYAVREYRRGDPLKRIDWNQYASSRELATLQFRTERAAAVVLLVDVRNAAYVRAGDGRSHAVDRGVEAASRLFVTLLEESHRVGIATLGPEFWLAPSDSSEHRRRGLDAFSTEEAFASSPPERKYPTRLRALQLLQRLTEPSQIIVCTPLIDDVVEVPIQVLESAGHDVSVVSPDPTRMDSRGGIVATLERHQRISRIQGYGVPVVDWSVDQQLDVAIARTMEGWSR